MALFRVIMLPGSVLPAELAYPALVAALGPDAEVVMKELEVYATPEAPPDYSLDLEVAGVLREADALGWERFHMVGYSGGGAAALALAAARPERLSSLALLEPAWAGRWDRSPAEEAMWREYDRMDALPPNEVMCEFMRLQVKTGVALPAPPAGDPPPWITTSTRRTGSNPSAWRTRCEPCGVAPTGWSSQVPAPRRRSSLRIQGVFASA